MSGILHTEGEIVGGRYLVEAYIGAGGMQEVYRALDQLLGRPVALKAPKTESAEKRFKRSAVVSARVNHVNVAKTLDYLEENGGCHLIEEFVDGADLAAILKQNPHIFDPYLAAQVFHRLARGLAASHHAGVIHRDLKPSNVMVVGARLFRDAKITDFGIAKMAEAEIGGAVDSEQNLTQSATALGALPYMAPEMIQSFKDADKPADIWALGAMLYEIISGQKPFGVGYKAVPAIQAAIVPPLPASITSNSQFKPLATELHEIVVSCLQKDPAGRPQADALVSMCETLCYATNLREEGKISKFTNGSWGFIEADGGGKGVFFHVASVFGNPALKEGDRVAFVRHAGGGNDRAFPLVKIS